ncbi:hypothetical protein [Fictibacillus fluitans]|uniref:Lipoprotein n=1 Tax=Fictibacillus fluitans TaxID=3058422 RepID=A0ABT8HQI7_9BACL|nr:hypothetical protein [Fictibacillus sp. NE201]MDN4523035.1 hypothetical protein [Fictibacillus sp. NE201]
MKKILVVWVALCCAVLSGCGITAGESPKTSAQSSEQNTKTTSHSSEQKTKPAVKKSTSKKATPSEVPEAGETITGVWLATGKQDGVSSNWYFNNRQLTVNYVYHFSYAIATNKDSHGYTVVTIKNSQGKQQHALLLKRNGSNFKGITAEGEAYNKYLADGTVPEGQIIEFAVQKNAWGSMDEAINFYENTYKNTNNEISKEILWENYRRDLWSLVKEGTSGNKITLHWTNIGGAGGSYNQFVKKDETTEITLFDGNAQYPNHPTIRYTVRNSDYKVIKRLRQ